MQTPGGHIRIFKKEFLKECFKELDLKLFKHHREHAIHSVYWILRARNNMQENKFLKSLHELLVKQMFGQANISLFNNCNVCYLSFKHNLSTINKTKI